MNSRKFPVFKVGTNYHTLKPSFSFDTVLNYIIIIYT